MHPTSRASESSGTVKPLMLPRHCCTPAGLLPMREEFGSYYFIYGYKYVYVVAL